MVAPRKWSTRQVFASWVRSLAWLLAMCAASASAIQTDIPGPAGSGNFGVSVHVLANGNIVVADPTFSTEAAAGIGAVYLYSANGALISTLTGSTPGDHVGSGGVFKLANGNYVITSPYWRNNGAIQTGAATWADGTVGISGVVSPDNSLVGSAAKDAVGLSGIVALPNGNYVVSSPSWNNGAVLAAGAATWGNGDGGTSGVVSAANSLVGDSSYDHVGDAITVLANGNYVVASPEWSDGSLSHVGAVTWASGTTGIAGSVSENNSLYGVSPADGVGSRGVTALTNGNYVVDSAFWNSAGIATAGAVTWADGSHSTAAAVSSANSLIGTTKYDAVGRDGVTALSNGNYVVNSSQWNNGAIPQAGAATWGNGVSGTVGTVSIANSLVGSSAYDAVGSGDTNGQGYGRITALANGNYVVSSQFWSNGTAALAGAVTLGNGSTGIVGVISPSNSLVGSSYEDEVGLGVIALDNGNYVVSSPLWNNGAATAVGAATWGDGTSGVAGPVSASNSLIGSVSDDAVGGNSNPAARSIVALRNGHYVVNSQRWNNGAITAAGAVTWCNGFTATTGNVSTANSMVGTTLYDFVGSPTSTALSNGNYVISSLSWHNGSASGAGAATWRNGVAGSAGVVSATNSLVGTQTNDGVGAKIIPVSNGGYIAVAASWNNGAIESAGAVTLLRGTAREAGPINTTNSVIGGVTNGGSGLSFDYDAVRDTLVVGRPAENLITLLKLDALFENGFDLP